MALEQPPKWPLKFLRWFCKEESIDEIEGDLTEMFYKRAAYSRFKAQCFFIWNVTRSCRRINQKSVHLPFWTLSFVQTIRFLKRDGIYSVLNALSLIIGFMITILFVWYAEEELSYDQFHTKKDRIFRVSFNQYMDLGAYATTSYPVGPTLKQDFPEVEAMTRLGSAGRMPVRNEDKAFFEKVKFADEDFFKVFDFPLLLGDSKNALKSHNQVVISESLAEKYFPDQNPMGKQLIIGSDGWYDAEITGVYQDMPVNSHFRVDIILSYETLYHRYNWMRTLWQQMPGNYTYVLLNQESSVSDLASKLPEIRERYVSELDPGKYDLKLIPLEKIHFYEGLYNENSSNRSFEGIVTFGLVVLLILLIATINFSNITSSRYLTRIKEVGVRKVLGADRSQLLLQLLFQSFLLAGFSMILAWVLIIVALPITNELAVKEFDHFYLLRPITIIVSVTLILSVTLIVAIIPAIKVSAMSFLKPPYGGLLQSKNRSYHKSSMLLFQYLATFFLMVSSIVIYQQLTFMEGQVDRGETARLVIPINDKVSDDIQILQESLNQYSFISGVAASSHVPSFYGDSWPVRYGVDAVPVQTENFVITDDYLNVMSYEVLAGRPLDSQIQTDVEAGFLVNQTCVELLGFGSLEEAIGKTIFFGSDEPKKGKIVGVVEDFHFESFQERIIPALFQFQPYDWMDYKFLVVEASAQESLNVISVVEKEIAKIDPNWVVESNFYEDHFIGRFIKETAQGKLTIILTFIAILLTCLGQVGLILHFVVSRQKEMAVRKVLGATVRQLWVLMTRSYFGLMLLAIVLAVPICTYLLNQWLNKFYYRIELGPEPFLMAGVMACIIVISVISGIALKSANQNPVENLSEE